MKTKTKKKTNWAVTGLVLSLLVLMLAACGRGSGGGDVGSKSSAAGSAGAGTTETQGAGGADEPAPAAADTDKPKEKVTVNIGIQGSTGVLAYARAKGSFEASFAKAGADVKWTEFQSGPPHFEAIAAGRLDFASSGGTPVLSAQVGGVDFRAIAVTGDGRKNNAVLVPKDSKIKDIKELKGKKIAVAKGSSAYNFLYLTLDRAGLTDKDVKIIQLQPDEARPAFDSGAVDAWSVWEPYITTAIVQAQAKVLVTGEDLNIFAPSFLSARTKFTEEHPDLTVLFLKTYEQVRQEYTANLDETVKFFVAKEKLDPTIIGPVIEKSQPLLSPVTPEFAKAHQEQADFLFKVGGLKKQLKTSEIIENKFVEQALQEVKEGK